MANDNTALDIEAKGPQRESTSDGDLKILVSSEYDEYLRLQTVFQGDRLKKLGRKIDLRVLPQLILLYLLCYIDRSNAGNVKLFGALDDMKLSGQDWNTAMAVFFATYAIGGTPSNLGLKRFGPKIWLPALTAICGLLNIFQGCASNLGGLVSLRLLLGLAEAGVYPGCSYVLTNWYSPRELHFRMTVFYSGASLATAFSGLLAYAIGHLDHTWGYRGWRFIYVIEGLISVVVAFTAFFVLCPGPGEVKGWLTEEEKRFLVLRNRFARSGDSGVAEDEAFSWKEAKKSVRSIHVYAIAAVEFTVCTVVYGISFVLPTIINLLGYSTLKAQVMTAPPYVVACMAVLFSGWAADRYKRRMLSVVIPNTVACAGLVIVMVSVRYTHVPGVTYFGIFCMAAGLQCLSPATMAWIALNQSGDMKRAVSMAVMISISQLGGILGSNIYLAPEAPTYPVGFGFCLGILFVFGIIWPYIYSRILKRTNSKRDKISPEEIAARFTERDLADMGDLSPLFRDVRFLTIHRGQEQDDIALPSPAVGREIHFFNTTGDDFKIHEGQEYDNSLGDESAGSVTDVDASETTEADVAHSSPSEASDTGWSVASVPSLSHMEQLSMSADYPALHMRHVDKFLFDHYAHRMCTNCSLLDSHSNTWRRVIIPISFQSHLILQSCLAAAANQLRHLSPTYSQIALRYHGSCLHSLHRHVSALSSPRNCHSATNVLYTKTEILGAVLMLCVFDYSDNAFRKTRSHAGWKVHLEGARRILESTAATGPGSVSPECDRALSSFLGHYLTARAVLSYATLADTAEGESLLRGARYWLLRTVRPAWEINPFAGCSNEVLGILLDVMEEIRRRAGLTRSEGGEDVILLELRGRIDGAVQLLPTSRSTPANSVSTDDQLSWSSLEWGGSVNPSVPSSSAMSLTIAEAFRQAAKLLLQYLLADPGGWGGERRGGMRECASAILASLSGLKSSVKVRQGHSIFLWPYFLAACHVVDAGERSAVLDMFRELKGAGKGARSVVVSMVEVIESVWKHSDLQEDGGMMGRGGGGMAFGGIPGLTRRDRPARATTRTRDTCGH
ncbi:uncharacterized protein DNG_09927 [Cephalotrichum gorgonifer]|uniref:Major facilitator superfamily (MFS) profile domain-containing protein n=1 Tax=Cephalotrichum gorgonifer TaxID=2041049 RepID=A0AAE8N8A6_9PEZI|nr:uncharacterized protein DNG_09927 [Cephalotrichum gorgonifer]